MAVAWDSVPESEFPAMTTFGGYDKLAREAVSIPIPVTHQHQHHFHYPGGVYHTLGKLSGHKNSSNSNIALWSPSADVRETELAYHIDMEVPGVSEKKAIKIAWLSPTTFHVDGVAVRPDLIRGREGEGEPMWESDVVSGGNSGSEPAGSKPKDGGGCAKCADSEEEMTTRFISSERKIGAWRRNFTLPGGCDMSTLKAKLDAGMLHISVFKKAVEGNVVEVE